MPLDDNLKFIIHGEDAYRVLATVVRVSLQKFINHSFQWSIRFQGQLILNMDVYGLYCGVKESELSSPWKGDLEQVKRSSADDRLITVANPQLAVYVFRVSFIGVDRYT